MKRYAEKPERIFLFDHDGRRYIASFTPFLPASGNGWLIVVIVPEEEFFPRYEEASGIKIDMAKLEFYHQGRPAGAATYPRDVGRSGYCGDSSHGNP